MRQAGLKDNAAAQRWRQSHDHGSAAVLAAVGGRDAITIPLAAHQPSRRSRLDLAADLLLQQGRHLAGAAVQQLVFGRLALGRRLVGERQVQDRGLIGLIATGAADSGVIPVDVLGEFGVRLTTHPAFDRLGIQLAGAWCGPGFHRVDRAGQLEELLMNPQSFLLIVFGDRQLAGIKVDVGAFPVLLHRSHQTLTLQHQHRIALEVAVEGAELQLLGEVAEQVMGLADPLTTKVNPPVLNRLAAQTAPANALGGLQRGGAQAPAFQLPRRDQARDSGSDHHHIHCRVASRGRRTSGSWSGSWSGSCLPCLQL